MLKDCGQTLEEHFVGMRTKNWLEDNHIKRKLKRCTQKREIERK